MKRPERIIDRSYEMILGSYYLARCGQRQEGGPTKPPENLKVDKWQDAYDLFFEAMGDGRERKQFRNSMKNARDAFDAHLPGNGRRGWVDSDGRQPPLGGAFYRVYAEWNTRSDAELEDFLFRFISGDKGGAREYIGVEARTEGGTKVVISTRRERDPRLRADAIKEHGLICMGCDFSYEDRYGELGAGFIEVHHAVPLSKTGFTTTDPKTDLQVLCANCHRMVHRRHGVVLTIEELKTHLKG